MALQVSLPAEFLDTGLAVPEAYLRVQSLYFLPAGGVSAGVAIYYTAAARQANKAPLRMKTYTPASIDMTGAGDARDQVYAYLKTLPEFAGATDV